jgi:hypothetical protein
LSSYSGDQLCSPPAILLWSWVFSVFVYWGLVSLPGPLSLGQCQQSVSWLPAASMLCCFADCFSILQHSLILCCSLAQEMSFVDCYLPYFRQWLITHPLSALFLKQSLFTESLCRDELLAPPPFSGARTAPCPLW